MMTIAMLTETLMLHRHTHGQGGAYDMLFPLGVQDEKAEKTEEGDKQGGKQATETREEANGTAAQVSKKSKGKTAGNGERDPHTEEKSLQKIWQSCREYGISHGRSTQPIARPIWKHAVWAWRDGWLHGTMSRQHASASLPDVAVEDIEDLGIDTWMIRDYRDNAPNLMGACSQLWQNIYEEAFTRRFTKRLREEAFKRARLGVADRIQTCGFVYEVTTHDGQKFRGRLIVFATTAVFEEESTHFRVTVPNEVDSFRIKKRDHCICVALRAKHLIRNLTKTAHDSLRELSTAYEIKNKFIMAFILRCPDLRCPDFARHV